MSESDDTKVFYHSTTNPSGCEDGAHRWVGSEGVKRKREKIGKMRGVRFITNQMHRLHLSYHSRHTQAADSGGGVHASPGVPPRIFTCEIGSTPDNLRIHSRPLQFELIAYAYHTRKKQKMVTSPSDIILVKMTLKYFKFYI